GSGSGSSGSGSGSSGSGSSGSGSSGSGSSGSDGSSQAEVKEVGTTDVTRYDEQSSSNKGSKVTCCKEPAEGRLVTIHEYSLTLSWKQFKRWFLLLVDVPADCYVIPTGCVIPTGGLLLTLMVLASLWFLLACSILFFWTAPTAKSFASHISSKGWSSWEQLELELQSAFLLRLERLEHNYQKNKWGVFLKEMGHGSGNLRKILDKSLTETNMPEKTSDSFDGSWVRHIEKELPKTEKSSMNTSMVCSIISWKIAIIHRWNVPGALQSPKGMRLYANVSYGQVNVVFSWSFGSIGI
nr:hypothetical protein [Tanacetum cinerariifolium]